MSRRALLATAACLVLAGCSREGGSESIAEPAVSFPVTSTTAQGMPSTMSATTASATTEHADSDKNSDVKKGDGEPSTMTQSKKSAKATPSTVRGSSGKAVDAKEPEEPAKADEPTSRAATECVWPGQADAAAGEEYQHFCDGDWAFTTAPNEGDYFWRAKGEKWVSIEPAGETEAGDACYDEADFKGAPEELRAQISFCAA